MPSIGVNLNVSGHCSQGGRKYMEDCFTVAYQEAKDERDLEYAFIGIFDGHGGSEAATFAKEHLVTLIVSQKGFWSENDDDILRAIRQGYIATHCAMWREQEKWPRTPSGLPSTAGTTASVAFIRHGKIYVGHCGDSAIVLGYQEDGEKYWRAKPLTQDHKPESNEEKARIENAGGKVIVKSGVPRVVWNRPRIGHKGPVRRSTPIDEIPFLAVARSLGDLWSYNSELNQFVVSPVPDVRVITIDPKKFKCLIFGTDGLWNVMSANSAIAIVRCAAQWNERKMEPGKEWINPSRCLVEKALERWCSTKIRADNTSVVTIMLDPPGPPTDRLRRDALKHMKQWSKSYLTNYNEYMPHDNDHTSNMFDHHTAKDRMEFGNVPADLPNNGLPMMTRYDNVCSSQFDNVHDYNVNASTSASSVCPTSDMTYMNSFAEEYNSLLNSNYNQNQTTNYYNNSFSSVQHHDSYSMNHGTIDSNSSHCEDSISIISDQASYAYGTDTYSLTKLETRSEQQINNMKSIAAQQLAAMAPPLAAYYEQPSTSYNSGYDQYHIDHQQPHFEPQYDSITSSFLSFNSMDTSLPLDESFECNNKCDAETNLNEINKTKIVSSMDKVEKESTSLNTGTGNPTDCIATDLTVPDGKVATTSVDRRIQINEISSSSITSEASSSSSSRVIFERAVTRSRGILDKCDQRITRSKDLQKRQPNKKTTHLYSPLKATIKKRTSNGKLLQTLKSRCATSKSHLLNQSFITKPIGSTTNIPSSYSIKKKFSTKENQLKVNRPTIFKPNRIMVTRSTEMFCKKTLRSRNAFSLNQIKTVTRNQNSNSISRRTGIIPKSKPKLDTVLPQPKRSFRILTAENCRPPAVPNISNKVSALDTTQINISSACYIEARRKLAIKSDSILLATPATRKDKCQSNQISNSLKRNGGKINIQNKIISCGQSAVGGMRTRYRIQGLCSRQ